jgi:hypothetical protein
MNEVKTMTWIDPIVEEVRRVRDAYAAKFNYELDAIFRDLKEKEERSGHKLVSAPNSDELRSDQPEPRP